MNDDLDNFIEKGLFSEIKDLLSYGKVGFEKENLSLIFNQAIEAAHARSKEISQSNE